MKRTVEILNYQEKKIIIMFSGFFVLPDRFAEVGGGGFVQNK